MMINRKNEVSEILSNCGIENRYFQPPESLKMKFPCAIYELLRVNALKADNTNYVAKSTYKITYITSDYADMVPDKLFNSGLNLVDIFKYDNMYHYVFYMNF